MVKIALITMKGGSGKTTLALCLAAYWHKMGRKVGFVDTDPAATAWRLSKIGDRFRGLPFATAENISFEEKILAFNKTGLERVLIDTPGFESSVLAKAIDLADCILIPIRPSPIDFQVAIDSFNLIQRSVQSDNSNKIIRFVLTQSNNTSLIARQIRSDMEDAGFLMFSQLISSRVIYAESILSGTTPSFSQPNSKASFEIANLAKEIDKELKKHTNFQRG